MRKNLLCYVLIGIFCFWQAQVFALPEGASVVSGDVSFRQPDDNTLNIIASDKVIINYGSFSIGGNEAVHFLQPSASSVALNRVIGSSPSDIFGVLTATGKIFLINPNGILFGPGSQINVGSLLASTLDIKNEDFLNGNYRFQNIGEPARIVNLGTIRAPGGFVALLAQTIKNEGIIEADLGNVILAGCEKATLQILPDISIAIDEPVSTNPEGLLNQIENTGTIKATGGKVLIRAEALPGIFEQAVNQSGIIKANSLENRDGVIELVARGDIQNSGTLDTSGIDPISNGGSIKLYAKDGDLTLKERSLIDISAGEEKGDGGYLDLSCDKTLNYQGGTIKDTVTNGNLSSTLFDPENILIDSAITESGNITYEATNNITVNANVTSTDGDLSFQADLGADGSGVFNQTAGTLSSGGNITIYAGSDVTIGVIDAGWSVDIRSGYGYIPASGEGKERIEAAYVELTGSIFENNSSITAGTEEDIYLRAYDGNIGTSSNPITIASTPSGYVNAIARFNSLHIESATGDIDILCDFLIGPYGKVLETTGSGGWWDLVLGWTEGLTLKAASGAITNTGDVDIEIGTLTLSGNSIGTSAQHIETEASTINATSLEGNIYITEYDGATLSDLDSSAGNGSINVTSTTGNLSLGTVDAGEGAINLTASAGSIADATSDLRGGTITLSGTSIGTSSDHINTRATTLNATSSTGGIYLTEFAGGATLSNLDSSAGNGDINVTSTTGNLSLGTVNAGTGAIDLTAVRGSILDNNGADNNLTAGSDSNLDSRQVIGLLSDPLEVNINGGDLTVAAGGQRHQVSVDINGTVLPSNTLKLSGPFPGRVIFNGVDLYLPILKVKNLATQAALFEGFDLTNSTLTQLRPTLEIKWWESYVDFSAYK